MKFASKLIPILIVLALSASCKEAEQVTEERLEPQQVQVVPTKEIIVPAIDAIPNTSVHEVEVLEVEHANSYTYLKVTEADAVYWIAITKREIEIGEEFSFGHTLKMEAFKSKDLNKTFADIYFVGRISLEDQATTKAPATSVTGHKNIAAEDISVAPAQGGVSIGELFANKADYADKTVRVRGQVTKISKNIMGTNWIHLQDGTGQAGTNDLTVTTDQTAAFGEVVTFEGTIILNKNFGAGYSYEVIMQKAKRVE